MTAHEVERPVPGASPASSGTARSAAYGSDAVVDLLRALGVR